MLDWLNRLYARLTVQGEEGQGLVEYGLIIVLVSLVVIAVLALVGGNLQSVFGDAANQLNR